MIYDAKYKYVGVNNEGTDIIAIPHANATNILQFSQRFFDPGKNVCTTPTTTINNFFFKLI